MQQNSKISKLNDIISLNIIVVCIIAAYAPMILVFLPVLLYKYDYKIGSKYCNFVWWIELIFLTMISAGILHFINDVNQNQINALNLPAIIKYYIKYLHVLALPLLILYNISGLGWITLSWLKHLEQIKPRVKHL